MPRTSDMFPSRFLRDSDLQKPLLLTIKRMVEEQVGSGKDAEDKWVLYFNETSKCITLNKTNTQRIEKALGSDNTDDWLGKQIVVYWDADVEYKGEITGGIRIRGPKKQDDDLPF